MLFLIAGIFVLSLAMKTVPKIIGLHKYDMKKNGLLLFVLVTALAAIGQCRVDTLIAHLNNPCDGYVMAAVHRGDWRYAPENSIAAIEHCIEMGADIVELDLQLTRDSVLIVMHDTKVDRTTTGKGKVNDLTLDEIKSFQLRNGCNIKTAHKVPTLREAMLAAKGKILVNLDKADTYFDLVLPILRETGTARQTIIKSNRRSDDVLADFGDGYREIIYMPKVNFTEENSMDALEDALTNLESPILELKYADADCLERALAGTQRIDGTKRIWYNTLWDTQCGGHDDEVALRRPDEAYGYLIDTIGASVLQTDRAALLLDYLRSRHLHD